MSVTLSEKLNEIIQVKNLPKRTCLLKEGEISNEIYFVEKGFLRSFYVKDDKEITAWFMSENDVVISVTSFFKRVKSYESIETLEDSILHFIKYDELEDVYKNFPEFNLIGRLLTTHYYIQSEERVYNMRKQSASERYQFLIQKHPHILIRASLTQISSYLGVSLETLSRVRAKR